MSGLALPAEIAAGRKTLDKDYGERTRIRTVTGSPRTLSYPFCLAPGTIRALRGLTRFQSHSMQVRLPMAGFLIQGRRRGWAAGRLGNVVRIFSLPARSGAGSFRHRHGRVGARGGHDSSL